MTKESHAFALSMSNESLVSPLVSSLMHIAHYRRLCNWCCTQFCCRKLCPTWPLGLQNIARVSATTASINWVYFQLTGTHSEQQNKMVYSWGGLPVWFIHVTSYCEISKIYDAAMGWLYSWNRQAKQTRTNSVKEHLEKHSFGRPKWRKYNNIQMEQVYGKQILRITWAVGIEFITMESGYNWIRIVYNGRLWY